MATLRSTRQPTDQEPASDPRWPIVERARAQLSPRLSQLLTYLCERALLAPGEHVTEERIGMAVFQRPEGYDTGVDTIVRVQVSQLRRKLEHHFLAEGRQETTTIVLPKGSYTPVFIPRDVAAERPLDATAPPGEAAARPSRVTRWLNLGLGIAVLLLAADNVRLRLPARDPAPHVTHFWREFAQGRRPTAIVISDASVTLLAEAIGKTVPLSRYRHSGYPRLLTDELALDVKMKTLLHHAALRGFTTWQDAAVARDVSLQLERQGSPAAVVSARNLQLDFGNSDNVVLVGAPRANPWMELFEAGRRFEYRFDDATRSARLVNREPRAGEPAEYGVSWETYGHCVLAYAGKPRGPGRVLLLYATDLRSVTACGHFVGNEAAMADLHRRLGVGLGGTLPYFEVLLRANLSGGVSAHYEVVAHRVAAAAGAR